MICQKTKPHDRPRWAPTMPRLCLVFCRECSHPCSNSIFSIFNILNIHYSLLRILRQITNPSPHQVFQDIGIVSLTFHFSQDLHKCEGFQIYHWNNADVYTDTHQHHIAWLPSRPAIEWSPLCFSSLLSERIQPDCTTQHGATASWLQADIITPHSQHWYSVLQYEEYIIYAGAGSNEILENNIMAFLIIIVWIKCKCMLSFILKTIWKIYIEICWHWTLFTLSI